MDDAAQCRQIVRTHARTFWLASHFLPPEKRRSAYALYAFCRVADDLVDRAASDSPADVALRFGAYCRHLRETLANRPKGAVFRELHRAVRVHDIPAPVFQELLEAIASDCTPASYATWPDLYRYCEGVASTVGEMCTYVFGVTGGDEVRRRALTHARILGVAMQLTNILRDVGEDYRNGRIYLPREELIFYGIRESEIAEGRITDNWRQFMKFQIERTRQLYAEAWTGVKMLEREGQLAIGAASVFYQGILDDIEKHDYNVFARRASLNALQKVSRIPSLWLKVKAL